MNDYDFLMGRLWSQKAKKKLRQSDIAKRMGCTQPAVSQAFNADSLSLRRFLELCNAMGLKVELREVDQ